MVKMFRKLFILIIIILQGDLYTMAENTVSKNTKEMNPVNLTCEYIKNPLGIQSVKPRLNWQFISDNRNEKQTAYHILAASNPKWLEPGKADIWDTGKIISGNSIQIEYNGKTLSSGQRVWWIVRVWNAEDIPSKFSQPAYWEMGLLNENDWTGQWIHRPEPEIKDEAELYNNHPAPLFRKTFALSKAPRRARLYITGLGYYEAYINGKRIGDHCLDPGWTNYKKRILYSVYDITENLKNGKNAIGVMLGNGWYNPLPLRFWGKINLRDTLTTGTPRLIAQLNIEYEDGTKISVVTNKSWKTAEGPILKNNIYLGEVYDARMEIDNWNKPDFDDSKWSDAKSINSPGGHLEAQSAPPIRITKKIKPISKNQTKSGSWIIDMGQNFAGWVKLHAKGNPGTIIKLRYAELLYPDGTLNPMTSVCGQIKAAGIGGKGAPDVAEQSDTFILSGTGKEEEFCPRFTFHGFRYVEIIGYPGEPELDAIEGLRLNSDVEKVGKFECSDELFNKIQNITQWTLLSNLFSVQSDCPHRERFGYGGDIVAAAEMAILNHNMAGFYSKAVQDLSDDIRSNGGLTETAPFVGIADDGLGELSGPVEWGTAYPFVQHLLWQYYGDRKILENNYSNVKKWMDLLQSKANDYILMNGIGDHETLVPKSPAVVGTSFFYLNSVLAEKIAHILNLNDDAKKYSELAEKIKNSFKNKLIKTGTGICDIGTQACQAIPIYFGLLPDEEKAAAIEAIVNDVLNVNNGHLTTGIFGTRAILFALSENNQQETAMTIAAKKDFPGWGYMIEKGATTLWEHWEFSDNTFSHNHPMFGSVSEWFIKNIAGIQPDADAYGFDKIIIKPLFTEYLTFAAGEYKSIRGMIKSNWRNEKGILNINIIIPPNTSAKVYLPLNHKKEITENNIPLKMADKIKIISQDSETAIINIGSGEYSFSIK